MSTRDDLQLPEGGDDQLAAEYVLGVLDVDSRAIATARIENDRAFAALVDGWVKRLEPLNDTYANIPVPASIKAQIDKRLFGDAARESFWSGVRFWRALAFGSMAALAVAVWPQMFPKPVEVKGAPIVASLQSDTGEVRFLALYEPGSDEIRITRVKADKAQDRDFELWLVDDGAKPVSMGVLPASGETRVKLKPELAVKISAGDAFAVSDEPKGGSPTGEATGPVIAVGATSEI